MNDHSNEELAALYAAGALPFADATEFESALATDAAKAAQLAGYADVLSGLFAAIEPIEPSPNVRSQLLAKLDTKLKTVPSEAVEAVFVQLAETARWRRTPATGVEMRLLNRDLATKRRTYLLRIAAGAEFPSHDHDDVEECYVLEGDVFTFGRQFKAGDFMCAGPGSSHGHSFSKSGCVLLISSAIGSA